MHLEEGSSTVQKMGQNNNQWDRFEDELQQVWAKFGMRHDKQFGVGLMKSDAEEKKRLWWIYEVKTPEILDDSINKGKPKVNPHRVLVKED